MTDSDHIEDQNEVQTSYRSHAALAHHHMHLACEMSRITSADIRHVKAAKHYAKIILGELPDRGDFDNAADAEAAKHED